MTMPTATATPVEASEYRPSLSDYVRVAGFLAIYGVGLATATRADGPPPPLNSLLAPIGVMLVITLVVWLAMVIVRNYAAIRGLGSAAYFIDLRTNPPAEWVERPARTFNNLMQVPTLFYVACILMMITQRVDAAALALAWIFVVTRACHAAIYMVWNHVPSRFATWIASVIALIVLWTRFLLCAVSWS